MPADSGGDAPRRIGVMFVNTRSGLGADVAVHALIASHLDPARCDVWFATNRRAPDRADLLAMLSAGTNGCIRILELDFGTELTGLSAIGRATRATANLVKMGAAAAKLAAIARRERIGVLHVTDRPRDAIISQWISRLTRARALMHLHIQWTPDIDKATQRAAKHAHGLLAISRFVERSLTEGGVPAAKVHVALNSVDANRFDPDRVPRGALRKKLGLSSETPLVGIVGRVLPWKGHIELLDAWTAVSQARPEARLVIVGPAFAHSRQFREQVAEKIERLGLSESVLWGGWWRRPEEAIADLDLVVVPSFEEPFGLIVIEAMAMRKPVIGFCSGALPEILASGREGILVGSQDVRALGAAISGLLGDPERRAEMGRLGRARVLEAFLPERQAAEVEAIYRKVAAGFGAAHRAPLSNGVSQ